MLPRKAGNVPSLELFKAMLDGALSKLVYWNVSQPMAKGLELIWSFQVPSNANCYVILWPLMAFI